MDTTSSATPASSANLSTDKPAEASSVLRSAGAMGAGVFLSRVMGLAREQVFASLFGAGVATDAFNVAFRIPNLLRDLFAEGAMSAALVPVFTRIRKEEGDRRAWRIAGLVFRALFMIVAAITLAGMLYAEPLVAMYASSYKGEPGKFELTVRLTRILYPFFPMVALAAAFMGVLNACGRFFIPAFSSALFNIVSVTAGAALALLFPRFGRDAIEGMAWGVLLGGFVQAACQIPALRQSGYRFPVHDDSLDRPWSREPALRRMLGLMVPGFVGMAATQVNVLINTILATSQGTGAVSWLNYAFRLMQFPIGIFGVSMAAATLPRVSALWVDRDAGGAAREIERSVRQVLAINLPASAGLAFLGVPIIQALFQYGRFTESDSLATGTALAAYSLGLAFYSITKVLVPACYAIGRTRVTVVSSLLSVASTLLLNTMLVRPLGFAGLAIGTSIAAVLNSAVLWAALSRGIADLGEGKRGLGTRAVAAVFVRHAAAALLMGAVVAGTHRLGLAWLELQGWSGLWTLSPGLRSAPGVALARLAWVGALMLEGVGLAVLLAKLLKLEETLSAVEYFGSRLKKRLRRG